jgi:hypothetical protein
MGMQIIAIVTVLALTYLWLIRGFFSALLHLICTIVAGAIAFAVWEPAAYWLVANTDPHGIFAGSAWGIALAVPFAVALILLRLIVDALVPANAVLPTVPNYIGGGVCGVATGIIASGFLVLSASSMRIGTAAFGYQPIVFSGEGSVVREGGLWLPTDRIVSALYGHTSRHVFGSTTPLAVHYHDLPDVPHLMRMSFGDGANRITARPEDVSLIARYTIGDAKSTVDDLLIDGPFEKLPALPPQRAKDIDGKPYPQGSRLEGVVVQFNAGAREKTEGKVSVGPSQVRLLVGQRDPADANNWLNVRSLFPIAALGQAEAATPRFARFRYDARDVYLASVGGASTSVFAFEFVVPPGLDPISISVKGVRMMIADNPTVARPVFTLKSPLERDVLINAGRLPFAEAILAAATGGAAGGGGAAGAGAGGAAGAGGGGLDESGKIVVGDGRARSPNAQSGTEGWVISERLPNTMTLQKSTTGGLEIDDKNFIINGEHTFEPGMARRQGVERTIRIDSFLNTPDTRILQLEVHGRFASSLLGQSARTAELVVPPQLRDTNGQVYEPIGFIYEDNTQVRIRYTPGEPIRALSQLPSLSSSRPDQRMTLLFRVSKGVDVFRFNLGNKVITEYNPPIPVR